MYWVSLVLTYLSVKLGASTTDIYNGSSAFVSFVNIAYKAFKIITIN